MNYVTKKGKKLMLIGETITKGQTLSFKAVNKEGYEVKIDDIKGSKVISLFPKLNTSVCDEQTQEIAKLATKHPNIKFISITMDSLKVINDWCLAHDLDNVVIWTDAVFKEFSSATNTLIEKLEILARGFIVLDDKNKVIEANFTSDLSDQIDFNALKDYLL